MKVAFDLISDLHLDTWDEPFDWNNRATSPYCIVAGDIAEDKKLVYDALTKLGQSYQAVFYIDGNDEHCRQYHNLSDSFKDITKAIAKIPNVVYLQDNVVVIDNIAILGTNGWWGFDFELSIDPTQCAQWWYEKENLNSDISKKVSRMATNDAAYMINSVKKLQSHQDVKHIIMVTHTVPSQQLIEHDIDLEGSLRFNMMGNRDMLKALAMDHQKKIHTWCFGHYHGAVDQMRHNIRFVNNCRGRKGSPWSTHVYHPRRIEIQ
jgi:predicted phosphodiesterase